MTRYKVSPTGVVFDIHPGTVQDGPGIRQTVFLKGCPLACNWCHNPEGLSPLPELLVSIQGCTGCGRCMQACPRAALGVKGNRALHCDACGACVQVCPQRIRRVAGKRMTARELAETLALDADYYHSVGGGVTFSGGEPLLQADFVLAALALLPPYVHTAVETSGFGAPGTFRRFMDAFDLIMLDLKQTDDAAHRRYTGRGNALILDNARQLCLGNTPFIVRIPVIPGVNDNDPHYRAVASLVAGAPALLAVELLPYHRTAGAKYAMAGRTYRPAFPEEAPVHLNQGIFTGAGIRSIVL